MKKITIVLLIFLTACTSPTPPPPPDVVLVQYTFSTQDRLPGLYSCASDMGVTIAVNMRSAIYFDSSSQLTIRIGEAEKSTSIAYEIGSEEIVVVVNPGSSIKGLDLSDVRALFNGEIRNWKVLGGGDQLVQVWTYPSGEDIREIFDAAVMHHQPVTSDARLAVNTDKMITGVGSNRGAIGYITRSLVGGNLQLVDTPASLTTPILIIPSAGANQTILELVSCMQRK